MPTIGPYTFSVRCGGRRLHEHPPPVDEIPEVSGEKTVVYIQATKGAEFEIKCKVRGHLNFSTGYVSVNLDLDNRAIVSHTVKKSKYCKRKGETFVFNDVVYPQGQTWMERNFQFSNLVTTDAGVKSANLKEIGQYTGTIRLRVCNMTALDTKTAPSSRVFTEKVAVPEKALKGQPIDMATDFGEAKQTARRRVRTGAKRMGPCLVDCVFKYRSRKALQILDLIPAIPDSVALHKRDPNTLNLAEARELLSQIQRQGKHTNLLKQECFGFKREEDSKTSPDLSRSTERKRKSTSITPEDGSDDDDVIFIEAKRIKSVPSDQVEVLDLP